MTQTAESNKSLSGKAHFSRRWGLIAIILGFLIVLQILFGPDAWPWTAPLLLLVIVLQPSYKWRASWMRKVGMVIIVAAILAVAEVGLARFSLSTGLDFTLALGTACLALGIILQLVAEAYEFSESTSPGRFGPLLDKIRRL